MVIKPSISNGVQGLGKQDEVGRGSGISASTVVGLSIGALGEPEDHF